MVSLQDVFISYGRADSKSFAQRLNQRLTEAGLTVWFDFDDIPFGVDYQDEIDAGIGNADNFLFVISPHSVNSPYCAKEVKLALAYNKRIIPLMHVEEISRETWQGRNPNGTDADWHDYQSKGLHSSFPNLHAAVGRINWIFCREGIDDFDQSCDNLLTLLQQQKDYVRDHTVYLNKALEWDQNQRQGSFLLPDSEVNAAKSWLQTRFTDALPPCSPTNLHSEFIAASIKQQDDGMTDVFISYSEKDMAVQQQVRLALARQGVTAWTNRTDIRTGTQFQEAIYSGIEKADTIVFLLSPNSLSSRYCQDELSYSRKYNKRIIPVLITAMEMADLPPELQSLQLIDGTSTAPVAWDATDGDGDELDPEAFLQKSLSQRSLPDVLLPQAALDQLIRALTENSDYYAQHKRLLVKALHWDRQNRPNDEVLRGQEFVAAETWLQISKQTGIQSFPPTRLHNDFIATSQAQNRFFDAFISYGRADSLEFASQLYDQLVKAGLNIWFDQQDIPAGVDFQAQIDDGIERSHNFIFIIAPHSVHSPYCLKEIELALKYNKRIIPLMNVEEISSVVWRRRFPKRPMSEWDDFKAAGKHSSFTKLHPEIGKINWIFFREDVDDFIASLGKLNELIRQHEPYVRQHTNLLTQALDWERHDYGSSYLLTGEERQGAETWLKQEFQDQQAPCYPTILHSEFIGESLKQANNSMTDVFLCYAEGDDHQHEVTRRSSQRFQSETDETFAFPSQMIRRHLMFEGLTVWDYMTDIQSGETLQTAIARGIEAADSVIFILSEASTNSPHCLKALAYSAKLNKRIIPVVVDTIPADVPKAVKRLKAIDLSQDMDISVHIQNHWISQGGMRLLIQALLQDATYYKIHKRLLAIALKWERQQENPTILLRGKTLKQYDTWFKVASKRAKHPPIKVQQRFIIASRQQPPLLTLDVFIIYAPTDFEFVRRLNDTLQIQNKRTWFDETIAGQVLPEIDEVDPNQLTNSIDQSENIIFVISPNAIKDAQCLRHLEYAHKRNKRIIPVLYRDVFSGKPPEILDEQSWLDFQSGGDFLTQFGTLYRMLESDPEHIRPHTLLMVRSQQWDESHRDDSYLLRGQELKSAQAWLQQAVGKTPAPTDLQRDYIEASRTLPLRRVKPRSVVFTGIAVTAFVFVLRLFGFLQAAELFAYDRVLRHRFDEPQDDRFLIVKVDNDSGRWLRDEMKQGTYTPSIGTIPEQALAEAIANLQALQPSVIGLDFYRDFKADSVMADVLSNSGNLIGLCKAEDTQANFPGYEAPSEMPRDQVGFNDFSTDSNNFLRRYLLKNSAMSTLCPSQDSFSLLIARRYLADQDSADQNTYADPWDSEGNFIGWMQFGAVTIPSLYGSNAASYSVITESAQARLRGYQIPVHLRTHQGHLDQFAPSISLKDVIQGRISADEVRDRIIVIGYFDESDRNADFYNTSYGRTPGAILQAQLASQLISAALDGRSLIWWWPLPGELLWMLGWSLAGGFIVWGIVRPIRLSIVLSGTAVGLYVTCSVVMVISSGWIPLVPPLLTGGGAALITVGRSYRLRHP